MSLHQQIRSSVQAIRNSAVFTTWFGAQLGWAPGDLIGINCSFLLRKGLGVSTKKSGRCLALRITAGGQVGATPHLIDDSGFNTEFKRYSQANAPATIALTTAEVAAEVATLGDLVFSLIGVATAGDTTIYVPKTKPIPGIIQMTWRPGANPVVQLLNDELIVDKPYDLGSLWAFARAATATSNDPIEERHLVNFSGALRDLQRAGRAKLILPPRSEKPAGDSFLREIVIALQGQLHEYRTARVAGNMIDVYRIAYNFTSQVLGVLRMVFTVFDLKPVLQWATADKQLSLWQALQDLPWLKAEHKPKLDEYVRAVNDSRNASFHNALPFGQTMAIKLDDLELSGAEIRFFREHSDRNKNAFYLDELDVIEAFRQLSRAHRTDLPPIFWESNEAVLAAIIDLFAATENAMIDARNEMPA